MYLVNTRPDIFFALSTLSHYLVEAKVVPLGHSEACAEVPSWYCWIWFLSGGEVRLQGYTNFDWEGSAVDILRTSGCYLILRPIMIFGITRKHNFLALNTTKIEYIATSVTSHEAVSIHKILVGIHGRHGAEGSGEASKHIHK
jgi:hypothetical protein